MISTTQNESDEAATAAFIQNLNFEPKNYGVIKQYASFIVSYSTQNEKQQWNLINANGCFEIFDSSLKDHFIELEFPLKIFPQILFLSNKLNTDCINSISVKNTSNGEWTKVWDKNFDDINNGMKNVVSLNLVTFATNQMRFGLESNDISPFLPPFSLELQGLYTLDESTNLITDHCSKLLNDDKFSDVEFIVRNETIRAHKCILAMRSSYWSNLFKTTKYSQPIVIENTLPHVFKLFLRYLYTNNLLTEYLSPEIVCQLLQLSYQYEVAELKSYCYGLFCDFLSDPTQCMDLYAITIKYGLDDFTDLCLKAISFNFETLLSIRLIDNQG